MTTYAEQLAKLQPDFLEVTTLAASSTDDGERIVEGLAVPYGERIERPNMWLGTRFLEFAPGSATWRETAHLFYGHDHLDRQMPIGRVLEGTDDGTKGSRVRAKLSKTSKADDVYELLRDDVLNRFSVGFLANSYEIVDADTEDATLRITDADVFEVSVVPDPAYQTAKVEQVLSNRRKETGNMTGTDTLDPTTLASAEDVRELSTAVDTLSRRVETLGSSRSDEPAGIRAPGDSYGEFLQMVARGDREALDFLAAVSNDLGGLVRDGWVGDRYKLIQERRRVLNFFASSPLPAEGMNVEFGLVKPTSDTIQVDEQLAEGDTLAYGKLAFGTDTAPVKTFGGWSDMSRQAIDRSSVAVVERFFDALLNEYARRTELAVRTALANATGHVLAGTGTHDLTTADGWIDFTVDAATWLDTKGLPIEGFLVAPDVFKTTAKITTGSNGDYLLDRNSGQISVPGLSGEIFTVPMLIVPTAATGFVRAAHSSAIRTFEDGAAPFRLQDDDITNLTKAMSVYGYMATAVEDADAIVAPDETV